MNQPAIHVEGLSKQYTIGAAADRHSTFYDLLSSSIRAPLKRLRQLGGQTEEATQFWALQDVNFEVQPGEVLGIIGRNGAGKSTLLKVLSRITAPTSGRVTVRGRMASLLEVGTGFHPELSGRENVFLNGAILGMSRREVASKFDEIVAFAELDKFVDTPVKRYSSGMYVRLAFAVAAHLDADVLLVDEVLAVGDLAFQRKTLGKMGDVARSGRTVLFVSHNLGAVRNLCPSVLLVENGCLKFHGRVQEGLAIYERELTDVGDRLANFRFQGPLSDQLSFREFVCRQAGEVVSILNPLEEFEIEVSGLALRDFSALNLSISLFRDGLHVAKCHDTPQDATLSAGGFTSRFRIPARVLRPGRYTLGIGAAAASGDWTWAPDVAALEFSENWDGQSEDRNSGVVAIPYTAERIQQ